MKRLLINLFLLLSLPAIYADARCEEIRVATASNFRGAAAEIARAFEQQTGHRAILIFGATGKHYAQILHGAPFDIFLAADAARPKKLEADGKAISGSRFTYATGRLALWSTAGGNMDNGDILRQGNFRRLAIANPALAPYGLAAQETLQQLGLWQSVSGKLVRGENIAQTFQFIFSGNAELGFVALSQLLARDNNSRGSWWTVPESLHTPIRQQAVLINDSQASVAFMQFLRSPSAVEIIRSHGYGVPDDQ